MEPAAPGQPLDGRDLPPLKFDRQGQAAQHGGAVHEHGAGAALPELAAVLGARQAEILAQHLEEGLVHRHDRITVFSVDPERQGGLHARALPFPPDLVPAGRAGPAAGPSAASAADNA